MDQLRAAGADLSRIILVDAIVEHPDLELAAPVEATITFPRVAGLADTDAFVARLFAEHGVAVAAGRFFGAPAHIRLSLAGPTETLAHGLERLGRALAGV